MNTITTFEQKLVEKIRKLSPEKLIELENFVDFLLQRELHLANIRITHSESVLNKVWDNPDDAEYDRL